MFWNLFHVLGIKKSSSSFSVSPAFAIGLTLAIAFILIASNFAIIGAQQQVTNQPGGTNNEAFAPATPPPTALRTFQSTNDSFRVQVPLSWQIDDVNNTDSTLQEEGTVGYGMLAQLCPEEEVQSTAPIVNSSSSNTSKCIASQNGVIHIIRYPDLETTIQPANNATAYHLQKLQEVGYNNIQIVNSTNITVNLTLSQANQTIATLPAKFVEMTYTTAAASSAPNEVKRGYFILTATNATSPNLGITKGYSVFYEDNSNNSSSTFTPATPEITRTTAASIGALAPVPLPLPVKQVFDSFELIVAPEVEQAILQQQATAGQTGVGTTTTGVGATTGGGDLNCEDITERNFPIDPNNDPHGFDGDNDGIGCETGAFGEVIESETGGGGEDVGEDDDSNGGDDSCHPSYPDACIAPPPPDLNCDEIEDTNFEVVGSDPHGFDGDNDGIGCESGGGGVPDDDDGGDDDGGDDDCIIIGSGNVEDECDETPDDDGGDDDDNGGEDDGGNEGGGEDDGGNEGGGEDDGGGDIDG